MPRGRRSVGAAKRHTTQGGAANNAPHMVIYTNTGSTVGSPSDTGNGSPPGMTDAKLVEWVTERAIAGLTLGWGPQPWQLSGREDAYNITNGSLPPPLPQSVGNDWYYESQKLKWGANGALNRTWWQRCAELGVKNVTIIGTAPSWDMTHAWGTTWENSTAWGASTVAGALTPTAGSKLADFINYCKAMHTAGFTGIWLDPEGDGGTHPFRVSYPGIPVGMNAATARSWIKLRGAQLEKVLSTHMPGGEFFFYHQRGADTLNELAYINATGGSQGLDPFEENTYDVFCAGLASGVTRVTITDETYYRGVTGSMIGIGSETADGHYNVSMFNWNGRNARQSKTLITPEGDGPRLKVMRNNKNVYFYWPTQSTGGGGEGWSQSFADNVMPILIREGVRWSQGGRHAMYSQRLHTDATTPIWSNHGHFEAAWQTYNVPGVAQSTAPTASITHINGVSNPGATTFSTSASTITVSVTATDDFAIDRIEWATDRAVTTTAGAPSMNFVIDSPWNVLDANILPKNTALGRAVWHMTATTEPIALLAGVNVLTLSIINIHGVTTTLTLTVDAAAYSYDFAGTGPWVGWTTVAGTVDLQSGKGRTETAATALASAGAFKNAANPPNFELTANATLTTVTSTEFYTVISFRAATNTFSDVRQFSSWNLRFTGITGIGDCTLRTVNASGVYSATLATGPDIDFVQGSILRVRVRCVGLNIKVRYWKNAETEPTVWHIDYTAGDAPTGTGMSLMIRNGSAVAADRVDWDDVVIAALPADPDPTGTVAATLANVTLSSTPGDSGSFAAPAASAIAGMSATPVKDYDWVGVSVVWTGDPAWGSVSEWNIVNGDDTPNNEKSASKPSNVTIENDATCSGGKFLRLATRRETWKGQPFSGVQMENWNGGNSWGNGQPFFVEVRLRWVGYEGCWPGPWMYDLGGTNSEIDIMETPNTRQPWTTLHPYGWSQPVHVGAQYASSNDGQWHRYGLRVDNTGVYRYFDNVQVSSYTNTTHAQVFVNAHMGLKFQHFCGGNWPDDDLGLAHGTTPRASVVFPNYFDCDWFRIYR